MKNKKGILIFPQVGVGVMIFKKGNVLMHQRKGSHGAGEFAFPGGHLEKGESFNDCAKRETQEEAGIAIKNVRFLYLANVKKYSRHYVHIGMIADWKSGTPKNLEPDKGSNWFWADLQKLPKPLFEMCRLSFQSYKTKSNYFDS